MPGYGYGAVGGHYPQIIGGPDTIVGGDIAAVVGAAVEAALANSMSQAREVDPRAVAVAPRQRDERRRLIMGNAPTTIPAAGTPTDVQFQPQQLFRTELMVVPSEIAPDLRFSDIRVGNRSQLVTTGSLPATAFSEVAYNSYVHFDTADIGNIITLTVIAKNGADVSFECVLFGTAVI